MPKISELPENTAPADGDMLVMVDVSDSPDATERITVANHHAQVVTGAGAVGACALAVGAADRGLYSPAANQVALATAGVQRVLVGTGAIQHGLSIWPLSDGAYDVGEITALRLASVNSLRTKTKTHSAYAGSESVRATGAVRTTDATVTTLFTYTIADNHLGWIEATIVGRDEAGTHRALYRRAVRIHRQGAGAVIGTVQTPYTDESSAGWDATIDASGNDIRVRVTGAAGVNISWVCTVQHQVVSTSA